MYYRSFCPGVVELKRRFNCLERLYGYSDDETKRTLKELIYFEVKAGDCQLSCVECVSQSLLFSERKFDSSNVSASITR